MMKFNIIKNELHNIMNTQLKRVGLLRMIFNNEKKERNLKIEPNNTRHTNS